MSHTRTREIVFQAFAELEYPYPLFGLHMQARSKRCSPAATNVGVSDRVLKRHGRCRTHRDKAGYV